MFCVGPGDKFALAPGGEAVAPELDPAPSCRRGFKPDAVDAQDGHPVGDGVGPLAGDPGVKLALLLIRSVAGLPTNGGGIDQQLRAIQCHQPGGFGIPLVPADQYAQLADGGLNGAEPEIAGGEVEFLVIGRIIRDVHLAIPAGN